MNKAYAQEVNYGDEMAKHMPLVKRIAYQVASKLPANVEVDDLIQEGLIGLLDALKRYQPQPNLSFEIYPAKKGQYKWGRGILFKPILCCMEDVYNINIVVKNNIMDKKREFSHRKSSNFCVPVFKSKWIVFNNRKSFIYVFVKSIS